MSRKWSIVAYLAFTVVACDYPSRPEPLVSSAPPAVAPPPPPSVAVSTREITVGESVEGIYGDGRAINPGEHHFWITPSQTGTLRAILRWDPSENGTLLRLTLDGHVFNPQQPSGWSPVVGAVPVEAGRRYLIIVSLRGADWLPFDRYTLTTSMDSVTSTMR